FSLKRARSHGRPAEAGKGMRLQSSSLWPPAFGLKTPPRGKAVANQIISMQRRQPLPRNPLRYRGRTDGLKMPNFVSPITVSRSSS
ncbi:hypothetical protein O181_115641, partial [Austropuccinia psidii MF-1]|nr:hypothetical protein [Austropuccinia psidii MF-1]